MPESYLRGLERQVNLSRRAADEQHPRQYHHHQDVVGGLRTTPPVATTTTLAKDETRPTLPSSATSDTSLADSGTQPPVEEQSFEDCSAEGFVRRLRELSLTPETSTNPLSHSTRPSSTYPSPNYTYSRLDFDVIRKSLCRFVIIHSLVPPWCFVLHCPFRPVPSTKLRRYAPIPTHAHAMCGSTTRPPFFRCILLTRTSCALRYVEPVVSFKLPPQQYALHLLSVFEEGFCDYHWYLRKGFRERFLQTYASPNTQAQDRNWLCRVSVVLALAETWNRGRAPPEEPSLPLAGQFVKPAADPQAAGLADMSLPSQPRLPPGSEFFEQGLFLLKLSLEEPVMEDVEALNLVVRAKTSADLRRHANGTSPPQTRHFTVIP